MRGAILLVDKMELHGMISNCAASAASLVKPCD
jgi:hypothetical protein